MARNDSSDGGKWKLAVPRTLCLNLRLQIFDEIRRQGDLKYPDRIERVDS